MPRTNSDPYYDEDRRREAWEQFFCQHCLTSHLPSELCADIRASMEELARIVIEGAKTIGNGRPRKAKPWSLKKAIRAIERATR